MNPGQGVTQAVSRDKGGAARSDGAEALPLLEQARRQFVGGLGYAALLTGFVNALQLTVPLFMLQLYDRVLNSHNLDTLAMLIREYAEEHGLDTRRFRIVGTDIDAGTLEAARRGLGVAIVPHVVLASREDRNDLINPLGEEADRFLVPSAGEYYLLVHERRLQDPLVVAFRSWLLSVARPFQAEAHQCVVEAMRIESSDLRPLQASRRS